MFLKISPFILLVFLFGCEQANIKNQYSDENTIDFIISSDQNDNIIKEIIIGGRIHSQREMKGLIKARYSNGSLTYKNDDFFDWWVSVDDDKSHKMSADEILVSSLRISDRAEFILSHLSDNISESISNEIVNINASKFKDINISFVLSDDTNLVKNSNTSLSQDIKDFILERQCIISSIPPSFHSIKFGKVEALLKIAKSNTETGLFNSFDIRMAEKMFLREIDSFRGEVLNSYISLKYDVTHECNVNGEFRVSDNLIANLKTSNANPANTLEINQIEHTTFQVNTVIESLNVVGKFMESPEIEFEHVSLSVLKDHLIVKNVSFKPILVNSIEGSFFISTGNQHYNSYILPGKQIAFPIITSENKSKFIIKNYMKGPIPSSLTLRYSIDNASNEISLDLDFSETDMWNFFVY
jgi:hypothetical protein